MDFNIITRAESHAVDLSKLGLPTIKEESEEDVRKQLKLVQKRVKSAKNEKVKEKRVQTAGISPSQSSEDLKLKTQLEDKPIHLIKNKKHYEDLWGAITRNIGKGFVLGYGGKVTVNILFLLLSALRGRKIDLSRKTLLLNSRDYGVFFGLLLGINNGIMYETKNRWDRTEQEYSYLKRYRGYIAGFLAGISLSWVPRESRKPIVIFAFVRALELQYRMAARRELVPCFENADTFLMSAASASMIHSWLFSPKTLDPSYVNFLSFQSPVPQTIVDAISNMQGGQPIAGLEKLNQLRAKVGASPIPEGIASYDRLPSGEVVHPGISLFRFFLKAFIGGMKKAVPVYLPVFTLPVLLFYPKSLLTNPAGTLMRTFSGVLRSSVFLALYCSTGVAGLSLARKCGVTYNNIGSAAHIAPAIAGGLAGLTTIIEKKGRRIELALYVLGKAVEGRAAWLIKKGILPDIQGGEVLVFMASLSVIMHAYVRHAKMIRPSYMSVMSRFFDNENRHVFIPKNADQKLNSSDKIADEKLK